jgi:hypothetical protein
MHLNLDFTMAQILWTLTFAALLVLLVVLLGRDRAKRYPWFTAGIVLATLRLLSEVLLTGRLPSIIFQTISIVLADLAAIAGLLVVLELAKRAFAGAQQRAWIAGTLAVLAVGMGVLAVWGPWLKWQQLTANPTVAPLNLMLLAAAPRDTLLVSFGVDKGDLLVNLLTVELGLLVLLFGRHFKAGWRSHTQQIAIGLSTAATAWLAIQGAWEIIARTAHFHTRAEYARIMGLGSKLVNANKVVYLAVLVWWIVWLWFDEPGAAAAAGNPPAPEAEEAPNPPDNLQPAS